MQVAGPYDVEGGIRRLLPKTLKILDGVLIQNFEWYLWDGLPVTPPNAKGKPLPNPHGAFRILSGLPRNAVAADADQPYRQVLLQQVDSLPFVTGTLTYEVTEQDIESILSITGTRAGVPGHAFVQGTDFTFDRKSIIWTGTGSLPDNATNFQVTYRHRMYYSRKVMDSRLTIRAFIRAKDYQVQGGRHYHASALAAVLGSALELKLRSLAAARIVRPATPDEPYTETMTVGRVLAFGPMPMDESGTLAPWFVDFTLNVSAIFETDEPVQSILSVPFEVEILP